MSRNTKAKAKAKPDAPMQERWEIQFTTNDGDTERHTSVRLWLKEAFTHLEVANIVMVRFDIAAEHLKTLEIRRLDELRERP